MGCSLTTRAQGIKTETEISIVECIPDVRGICMPYRGDDSYNYLMDGCVQHEVLAK
jgi:hypothetical protein